MTAKQLTLGEQPDPQAVEARRFWTDADIVAELRAVEADLRATSSDVAIGCADRLAQLAADLEPIGVAS